MGQILYNARNHFYDKSKIYTKIHIFYYNKIMKIIHCADIHADSAMKSNFDGEKKNKRKEEIVDAIARMVDYADKNEERAIIIAGDLFDTKSSMQKTIKKRIAYVISTNPQIDFLYLRGNHDEDSDFFTEDKLPNLKLFSKEEWKTYSYDDDKIQITGREFTSTIPAKAYSELHPDSSKVNIVVMHGQAAGYETKKDGAVISLPKFANQNIDYIALGHIHKFRMEKLDHRCTWCYPGCLEGRGFDECGEKGFVLLNIEDGRVKADFIPNARRVIHTVEVPLDGSMSYKEIMQSIEERVGGISADDIVQVKLTGEISEDTDIEVSSYESALAAKFFYIKVENFCQNKIDYEKYENDVSLKGEFIRLVKNQAGLSESEKSKIIMTGIKALAGRDF